MGDESKEKFKEISAFAFTHMGQRINQREQSNDDLLIGYMILLKTKTNKLPAGSKHKHIILANSNKNKTENHTHLNMVK